MNIATWNVNSLNVRLPHVMDWLASEQPDILCLQETKLDNPKFPVTAIEAAGYRVLFSGQRTYNGVAILSKTEGVDTISAIPDFEDEQKRVLAATFGDMRVICAYIPNGQAVDSDKYHYKLRWLKALNSWLRDELARFPKLVLLGDYNIAPEDRDCHDPAAWVGQVLVSEPERDAFKAMLELGLHDAFRLFEQPEKSFTWWDYRMMGFRRNFGMRIDHILLTEVLAKQCRACWIDKTPRKLERPSDHTPVVVEFK